MRRVLLVLALLLGSDAALAEAGKVLFAVGRVEVDRSGTTLTVQRGFAVEVGDNVRTGPTGLTQVRMRDGALLSLRPASSMTIEDFQLPVEATAPSEATPALGTTAGRQAMETGRRSVLRLLRGAFRTITGLVGKGDGDDYRVITPAATIGIRGTDYSAAWCSGDCGDTPDGLYVGVSNGEIVLSNEVGQLVLGGQQYAYVKDSTTPPRQELVPPDVLEMRLESVSRESGDERGLAVGDTREASDKTASFDNERGPTGDGTAGGTGSEDTITGSDGTVTGSGAVVGTTQPETRYELLPIFSTRSTAFATFFPSAPDLTEAGRQDSSELLLAGDGSVVGFMGSDGSGQVVAYRIGTAQTADLGFDPVTGLRWGRWTAGTASVGGQPFDVTQLTLHWIYGPVQERVAIPLSGTATYTLIGNTDPKDNFDNLGFLGSASFGADFLNQTVTSTLDIGINGQVWQASGSGSIADEALFNGTYGVSGDVTGTGSFSGFFTNNAAAAGLSYSLTDGSSTVSGVAAFEQSGTGP